MGGRAWEDSMSTWEENNGDPNSPSAEDFDIRTLLNYSQESSPVFVKKLAKNEKEEEDFWPPKFLEPPKTAAPKPTSLKKKENRTRPKTTTFSYTDRSSQDKKLNSLLEKCTLDPGNLSPSASSMLTIIDMDDDNDSRVNRRTHSAFSSMDGSSISWAEDVRFILI